MSLGADEANALMQVDSGAGEPLRPASQIEVTEALLTELKEFATAINERRAPAADGQAGLRVVQIVEAATQSMKAAGRPIELSFSRCTV